jgi:transcriptional regulator with XRE-family HTH domain
MASGAARISEFGGILRHWRQSRALSQLELAERAGISPRHLSFLETGRCGPSRAAVLQLGGALDLPEAEIERLLLVAGHAGDWGRSGDATPIREHLAKLAPLLGANEPFPALVSGPEWRVEWQNEGARRLFARFRELQPGLGVAPLDLRELFTDAAWFGQWIVNLDELLEAILTGLYQLEPDPVSFGHTRALLDVLPRGDGPGEAIERAARTQTWSQTIRVRDRGHAFGLEILSFPFAGGASGFALALARPADAASQDAARRYFETLPG